MKSLVSILMVFIIACAVPSLVSAEVITHQEGQIQITVPDTWKKTEEANYIKIEAPDKEMTVCFIILSPEQADKILDTVDNKLEEFLGGIKWENDGKPKADEINGMKGEIWNGTAKEGKFQVECIVLNTPSNKKLCYYWFDTPESEKKYEKDIETIVKGLKPIATTPAPTTTGK
ncbi:MAG: hypothetical protein HQM08_25215 [Candidatus Riflebacteria bacterium]|nr:hypothetical protein [Candidatus Riflebacteria bacterium]